MRIGLGGHMREVPGNLSDVIDTGDIAENGDEFVASHASEAVDLSARSTASDGRSL